MVKGIYAMKYRSVWLASLMLLTISCASESTLPLEEDWVPLEEEAIRFEANSGELVEAYRGILKVPENRADPASRMITLHYVRFPATGKRPGVPIVYLAGGPGGSGIDTAKRQRFPLFMAMRAFGDVIAFDQRGTGASNDLPRCISKTVIPANQALTDDAYVALHRETIAECQSFWKSEEIDLAGYTTEESVKDLDALRAHLKADKVSLWGISYGSHLALAALKQMEDRIDRVVLASAEGLAQTVKLPARTDAYFDRLQEAINTQPKARVIFSDIKALITRVHTRLEENPVMLTVPQADGNAVQILLQAVLLKQFAAGSISDPRRAAQILGLYAAIDADFYDPVIGVLQAAYDPTEPISWDPMALAMDIASGIKETRLVQVNQQAQSAILGDWLNFPMPHFYDAMPDITLDSDFRNGPNSAVPTLLLSGTLDGRTYPESQKEAVAGLSNVQIVTVTNAGHNLFMSSSEVTKTIEAFMGGEALHTNEIIIPLPNFAPF